MLEVLSELELRRKHRAVDFWAVARKLAAGEKVTAAGVEALLIESGKTPAELQAAVDLLAQRARWHEQRRNAAGLEKEQTSVQRQIAVEDRKLATAEEAHTEATASLCARLHEIRTTVSDAGDARRRLIETCPDAGLKAELAAVQERLARLRAEAASWRDRTELTKRADWDEETADRLAAGLVPGASTAHIDRLREQAVRKRELGRQAKAALDAVLKRITAAEREEEVVFERMTQP